MARKRLTMMIVAVTMSLAMIGGMLVGPGVQDAEASHGSNITLIGSAVSSAWVCAQNESNVRVGCVQTNGQTGGVGQYRLVVSGGHSYSLFVAKQFGCNFYYGSQTGWIWISNAVNPTFITQRLIPNTWTYWYRAC